MQKGRWHGFLLVVLAGIAAAPLSGQAAPSPTFSERLLEILADRGVLDSAEHRSLSEADRLGLLTAATAAARERDLERHISVLLANEETPPSLVSRGLSGWRLNGSEDHFRLDISGRLQVRFTHDFPKRDPEKNDEDEPRFEIARARLSLDGRAFREWMRYSVTMDLAGDPSETDVIIGAFEEDFDSRNRLTDLTEAILEFAFLSEFELLVGQMKMPYSRQYLTSSGRLEFVDRSVVRSAVGLGRSVGIMAKGEFGDSDEFFAEYRAGVFDGEDANETNDDKGLLWVGRLGIHPFGEVPYSEGGLHSFDGFRMALGFGAWFHQDDQHQSERDDWSVGGDLAVAWGPFSLLGELHYHERGRRRVDRRAVAWLLQVGVMVIPETFQIALRGAEVSWENSDSDAALREYLLALNWFFAGHDVKLQADVGWVEDHQVDQDENVEGWRFRLQLQVNF